MKQSFSTAAALFLFYGAAFSADVSSSFDTTVDGWVVVDLLNAPGPYTTPLRTFEAAFDASSGNSGGCIRYTDFYGDMYFFEAPAKFLGDRSASYGQALEFDIFRQPGDLNQDADVVLVGAGITLVIDAGPGPTPDLWTHYAFTLSEGAGWRKDSLSGPAPTEAEFRGLLQSLSALRIRGDHTNGIDTGRLDNVRLSTPVLRIVAHPQSQVGYWGKSVSFSVTAADGNPPYTYQWLKDSVEIEGATGSQIDLTNLQAENAGSYTVTVKDAGNTTLISQAATLVVNTASVSIATYAGLTIDGVIGQTYGIQATTDLGGTGSWTGVANVTLTQPAQIWYDSQSTAQQPKRFYRVVAGPISIP